MQIDPVGHRLTGDRFEARWRDLAETVDGTVWSWGFPLRPGRFVRTNVLAGRWGGGEVLPGRYGSDVVALAAGPATLWVGTDIAVLVRLDPQPAP